MRDLEKDLVDINEAIDEASKEIEPTKARSAYVRILNTWAYTTKRAIEAEKRVRILEKKIEVMNAALDDVVSAIDKLSNLPLILSRR